jgi:hypothetical protein
MTSRTLFLILLIQVFTPCAATLAGEAQWFRGNTHTHSLWSDGNDFPEMIADFYKREGYQFLVLSDHNVLSRGEKWMSVRGVEKRRKKLGTPTMKKYIARFGEDWVDVRGEGEAQEVRLKTLEEIRPKFDEPGKFLFVEGEEITDRFGRQEVHTNAVNLGEAIKPQHGKSLRDTMRNNLIAVRKQAERLKRPILAHLNHPNFRWSITAEDIAHVLEEEFFEVYNGHPGINHLGDATRPGDERIWDIANTIRLAELKAPPLYGIASDDSHYYHGGNVKPGRGWIVVRAEKLAADELVKAMQVGDFYASTGVALKSVDFDAEAGELKIEIDAIEGESYTTQLIGTRRGGEGDPAKVGEVFATVTGTSVHYKLKGDEWYVRATISSDAAHPIPSFAEQHKQAWIQPVGWKPAAK